MTFYVILAIVAIVGVFFVGTRRKSTGIRKMQKIPVKFMVPKRKSHRGKIKPGTRRYRKLEARKQMAAQSRQNNFRMQKGMRKR